ncbi:MAG: 6,7-dimethyl-8-ribityllumazine synthase [Dehalococcoidia bacterium]
MPTGGLHVDDVEVDATGLRLAIAVSRFNADVTRRLLEGCRDELSARGVTDDALSVAEVPGCFELPLMAKLLAASGAFDAIICLGAIIRGDTPHFEYVSSATASGIQRVALDTGVPVVFGVLTVDNEQQAYDRLGGPAGHKGREAALTAIEMACALRAARGRQA